MLEIFCIKVKESHSGLGDLILEVSKSRTVRHATCGRIPLDEGSVRRRDLHLT
jgi:hypothetical protein